MAYTKTLFMEERTKRSSQNQWELEDNFMSCNQISQDEQEMDDYYTSLEIKMRASKSTSIQDEEILPPWLDEMLEDEKFRQEIRKMKEEIDAEIVIYEKWKKIMEGGLNNKNLNTEFQHGSHISKII